MRGSASAPALARDIEDCPGARRARARMTGDHPAPAVEIVVHVHDDADLPARRAHRGSTPRPASATGWRASPSGPGARSADAIASSAVGPEPVELVEVRLLRLPLGLWLRAQEHADDLLREFALVAADADARAATPGRLLKLIDELTAGYGQFSDSQRRAMDAAVERGDREIDLVYHVPPGAAGAAQQLGDIFDEADEYCRRGDHLLTMATPPEQVRFRNWFIGEFVEQLAGRPPVPWPDYSD
jgi:hypothetical protein